MKKLYLLLLLLVVSCKNETSEQSILSILVTKDSEIKQEAYFNGSQRTALVNVQSITKSIGSLLLGIAIDKGIIEKETISIGAYFPEIEEAKKAITIGHLLNHTSGLDWEGYLEHEALLKSDNPATYVLSKNLVHEPGTIYNYNSGGTHLLLIIIAKASKKSTLEFAQEQLFGPLGIKQVKWGKLKDGHYDGAGFSLEMLPSDLVKIGTLFLKASQNKSEGLISSTWLTKMVDDDLKMETKWGLRNSKHGYGWYASKVNKEKVLYSMGYGGQFIFIIPSKEMVIVSTHNHDTPNGIEQQIDFLSGTFPDLMKKHL